MLMVLTTENCTYFYHTGLPQIQMDTDICKSQGCSHMYLRYDMGLSHTR